MTIHAVFFLSVVRHPSASSMCSDAVETCVEEGEGGGLFSVASLWCGGREATETPRVSDLIQKRWAPSCWCFSVKSENAIDACPLIKAITHGQRLQFPWKPVWLPNSSATIFTRQQCSFHPFPFSFEKIYEFHLPNIVLQWSEIC